MNVQAQCDTYFQTFVARKLHLAPGFGFSRSST